ncbi:DUF3800 domain-containing protein [Psychrobacter sp. DAB_AL62B]|uniref:DUF3800 domain-containing protein n=1 Tax=Psychrobacter sp. DAB_AL62B TaxID=1028420 RepID=UPI0023815610|nr:DUF3800 domain-containing protein [Psychrobacter sp. DAB_AL62B]
MSNNKKSATLYFDESGFTGNDLLSPNQTVFSYASVESSQEESENFVKYLLNKYHVQNGEIKSSKLLRGAKGKKLVDEVLEHYEGRFKVMVCHKKFALSAKFFEYIFEPALSQSNSLFYGVNFHMFISNMLYLELFLKHQNAEDIFSDFAQLMREGEFEKLKVLFKGSSEDEPIFLKQITEFAILNKEAVISELSSLEGTMTGKWILDLTNTSLFSLLGEWGEEYEELVAYCDKSKPLDDDQDIFNAMVGRKDKVYMNYEDFKAPVTFNLKEPLNLVDSKDFYGIQIADAIAGAFAYAFDENKEEDKYKLKWQKMGETHLSKTNLFPNISYLDMASPEVQLNTMILRELLDRSKRGMSLIEGMGLFIHFIKSKLEESPMKII